VLPASNALGALATVTAVPWIEVHPATERDEHALATLENAAWPLELRATPRMDVEEPFFGPLRQPGDVLVAVEEPDGVILGHVDLHQQYPVPCHPHVMRLLGLLVSPAARNQGIGAKLLAAGIEEARLRGARKIELRALETNATAIDLYLRSGFTEEARFRDEFQLGDGRMVDDVWYSRWIG